MIRRQLPLFLFFRRTQDFILVSEFRAQTFFFALPPEYIHSENCVINCRCKIQDMPRCWQQEEREKKHYIQLIFPLCSTLRVSIVFVIIPVVATPSASIDADAVAIFLIFF